MLSIDIDSEAPLCLLVGMRDHAQRVCRLRSQDRGMALPHRTYTTSGCMPSRNELGINTEKLIDWRRLESRAHELRGRLEAYGDSLRALLDSIIDRAAAQGCTEAWLLDDDPRATHCVSINVREGYFSDHPLLKIIERGLAAPGYKGLVIRGQESLEFRRVRCRQLAYLRRSHTYEHAFRVAVEARLRGFIKRELSELDGYGRYRPATIVVRNEGRTYVVCTSDSGNMSWLPGPCYATPGETTGGRHEGCS